MEEHTLLREEGLSYHDQNTIGKEVKKKKKVKKIVKKKTKTKQEYADTKANDNHKDEIKVPDSSRRASLVEPLHNLSDSSRRNSNSDPLERRRSSAMSDELPLFLSDKPKSKTEERNAAAKIEKFVKLMKRPNRDAQKSFAWDNVMAASKEKNSR